MEDSHGQTVTRLLEELRSGNRAAFAELLPLAYDELHAIAARQRQRWIGDETLNTTALVHEAYLRLVDQSSPNWSSHPHFLAVAATAMRQILLDYAKRKQAEKRGGGRPPVPLHEVEESLPVSDDTMEAGSNLLLALDASLRHLEEHDPRQSRIVECRFFGGLSIQETADALGISPATVSRGWSMAQAWLYQDLKRTIGERE